MPRGRMTWPACKPFHHPTTAAGLVQPLDTVLRMMEAAAPDEATAPVPPPHLVANRYLAQLRARGSPVLVDGRPDGLSAQRFAAAAAAAPPGSVNTAWLPPSLAPQQQGPGEAVLRQAALGHRFNHRTGSPLTFDLCPLPPRLPHALLRLLPSLPAGPSDAARWVPLVVSRAPLSARPGGAAELFVDYGIADPLAIGFQP